MEKTDLNFIKHRTSIVATPRSTQISFFDLKSRKPVKTRKFAVLCDTLKCMNVYPDKTGSGRCLLIFSTGGPRPNPNFDARLFDFKRDLEYNLLGPGVFVGDVPEPEKFKESIYSDALYCNDLVIFSQTLFVANQFAYPHITIIKLEYQKGLDEGGKWVKKTSVNSYLLPEACLYVQFLGFSEDSSRALCTDMSQKRFWISIADGKSHGYH